MCYTDPVIVTQRGIRCHDTQIMFYAFRCAAFCLYNLQKNGQMFGMHVQQSFSDRGYFYIDIRNSTGYYLTKDEKKKFVDQWIDHTTLLNKLMKIKNISTQRPLIMSFNIFDEARKLTLDVEILEKLFVNTKGGRVIKTYTAPKMALEIINANMPADMDYRQCRGLPFTLLCCESSESFNKIMSLKWKRTSSYISKLLQTSGFKNYDNNIYMFTEKNDLFIELMKSEYLRDFCTLNVLTEKDIANDALLNGYKIQNYYDIDYARIGNKSPGFMLGHTNKKVVKFDVRGERAVYSYIDKDGKTHFLGGGKIAALFTHFIVTCLAKARIPVNQLEMCVFLEDEVNLAASHNIKYVSGIPVEIFESPIYNIHDIDVNKKFFTQTSNSLGEKFIHLNDTEIQKNLHLAVYYDESGYGSIYCSKTAKAILHDYKSNVLNIIGDESVYFNRVKYSTMLQTFLDIFNPTGSDAISTVVAVEFCQACLNMSPLDVCNMYADNPSIYRIFKPSTDEERLQFFRTVYLQEIKNSHKKIKNKLNEIESSNNLFKILFKTTDDEEQFYLYYENLNKQMPPANFKGEAQSILAKAVAVINKSIYPSSMSY